MESTKRRQFYVYVLSCADDSVHYGITTHLEKRLTYHQEGKNPDAPTYTKRPVSLKFSRAFPQLAQAQRFHHALQKTSTEDFDQLYADSTYDRPIENTTEQHEKQHVILPPVFLGNLAYFSELIYADEIHLSARTPYQKQTYLSRSTILSANGVQDLIVPTIRQKGVKETLDTVRISYAEDWVKKHIRAIESAYRNAPYYTYFHEELFAILSERHDLLIDLNTSLLNYCLRCLGWEKSVLKETIQSPEIPHLQRLIPKNRLIHEGRPYPQVFAERNGFEPNLSVLDVIFNVGRGVDMGVFGR